MPLSRSPTRGRYSRIVGVTYIDIIKYKATTYERGRHFHLRKPLKEDGRAWEIPFGHGDELRGATSYGPPTTRRRQEGRARAIPFDHGDEHEPLQLHEDGAPKGLILLVKLRDRAWRHLHQHLSDTHI